MVITKDKQIYKNALFPNTNFTDKEGYVIDETTEDGQILAQKIIENHPYFELVLDEEGNLVDITPTERPEPEPIIPIPTVEERLQMAEDAIMFLLIGGM